MKKLLETRKKLVVFFSAFFAVVLLLLAQPYIEPTHFIEGLFTQRNAPDARAYLGCVSSNDAYVASNHLSLFCITNAGNILATSNNVNQASNAIITLSNIVIPDIAFASNRITILSNIVIPDIAQGSNAINTLSNIVIPDIATASNAINTLSNGLNVGTNFVMINSTNSGVYAAVNFATTNHALVLGPETTSAKIEAGQDTNLKLYGPGPVLGTYIDASGYILPPGGDASGQIGDPSARWATIYAAQVVVDSDGNGYKSSAAISGTVEFMAGAGSSVVRLSAEDLSPVEDVVVDLGESTNGWSSLYCTNIYDFGPTNNFGATAVPPGDFLTESFGWLSMTNTNTLTLPDSNLYTNIASAGAFDVVMTNNLIANKAIAFGVITNLHEGYYMVDFSVSWISSDAGLDGDELECNICVNGAPCPCSSSFATAESNPTPQANRFNNSSSMLWLPANAQLCMKIRNTSDATSRTLSIWRCNIRISTP